MPIASPWFLKVVNESLHKEWISLDVFEDHVPFSLSTSLTLGVTTYVLQTNTLFILVPTLP